LNKRLPHYSLRYWKGKKFKGFYSRKYGIIKNGFNEGFEKSKIYGFVINNAGGCLIKHA